MPFRLKANDLGGKNYTFLFLMTFKRCFLKCQQNIQNLAAHFKKIQKHSSSFCNAKNTFFCKDEDYCDKTGSDTKQEATHYNFKVIMCSAGAFGSKVRGSSQLNLLFGEGMID